MKKLNKTVIAYHGTSKENHNKIIKSGHFKKGTWFAFDKQDALYYGGDYIFKCYFNEDEFFNGDEDSWQFFLNKDINLFDLKTELDKEKLQRKKKEIRNKLLFLTFNYLCNIGLILFVSIMSINLIKTYVTHYESSIVYMFIISLIVFKLLLIEGHNKISELDILLNKVDDNKKDKSIFKLILSFLIWSLNLIISLIIALFLLVIALILLSFYVSNKLYLNFFLIILIMNVLKIMSPDVVKFNNTVWIIIDKLIESKFGKKIDIKLKMFIEKKCKK